MRANLKFGRMFLNSLFCLFIHQLELTTMRVSNWQRRESQELGLQRVIETAADSEFQKRMRAVREENARRVAMASK